MKASGSSQCAWAPSQSSSGCIPVLQGCIPVPQWFHHGAVRIRHMLWGSITELQSISAREDVSAQVVSQAPRNTGQPPSRDVIANLLPVLKLTAQWQHQLKFTNYPTWSLEVSTCLVNSGHEDDIWTFFHDVWRVTMEFLPSDHSCRCHTTSRLLVWE